MNHSNKDAGIYAAQLYLEAINVLGAKTEPPRPQCFTDMANDVPAFLELYCKDKKAEDNKDQCQLLTSIQFDVMRLKAETIVKTADDQQDSGTKPMEAIDNYRKGAEAYRDLWMKYCEGPLSNKEKPSQCAKADEIIYNMARSYQAGRLLAKSISARKILLDPKYGLEKSPLAQKAMYEIGGNYQAIAVYDAAAEWFEKYAKETSYKGESADQALSDAAVLRLGLGQDDEAIADANNFNRYYGARKPAQAAQLPSRWPPTTVRRRSGQCRQAAWWWHGHHRQAGNLGRPRSGACALGQSLREHQARPNAAGEYGKVAALWQDSGKAVAQIKGIEGESEEAKTRRLGRALESVGEALFFFAEEKKSKVDAVKFPEYKGKNDKESVLKHINVKVKEWIGKKRPLIETASAEYKKIVDLQPAPPPKWVIAAGSQVGSMWGQFVKEFRAAQSRTR